MIKSNGGIIGPDNVTTGGAFGTASGVFKLGEVTDLIKESKWPTAGPQGYQSANSCRFDGTSAYLNKTFGSAGNRDKWTFSCWVKKCKNGVEQRMLTTSDNSTFDDNIRFNSDDTLTIICNNSVVLKTNRVFRDNSAFYHICVIWDSGNGTSGDRCQLFVNGTRETSFSTASYPSQNQDSFINNNTPHYIGVTNATANSNFLNGYASEIVFLNDVASSPVDTLGEFNSQTGIWVPIDVSGLTFGTNGFYQNYSNASALGEDFSGNDNDFSVNNLTSIDQSTDTCSTNFCTMNPLDNYYAGSTFSEGNCRVVTGSSPETWNTSTFGLSSGKWYMEFTIIDDGSGGSTLIGIADRPTVSASEELGGLATTYAYLSSGNFRTNNSNTSNGVSSTDGDIIGVALNLDDNQISYYKNNTIIGSAQSITAPASTLNGVYFIASGVWLDADTGTNDHNFGNPVLAHSSSNTDGNGFGSFEYAPPAGYLSINTKNLAAVLA